MNTANRWIQPVALGLSDGILNALILATPAILKGDDSVTVGLALRVSAVALLTALFTVFVSEYAHLRADLARAEHELNISKSGRLATSNLGRLVSRQAVFAAVQAGSASFVGSLLPLLVGAAWSEYPWVAIAVALIVLGALGAILARVIGSRPVVWACATILGGAIIAAIGSQLHIV